MDRDSAQSKTKAQANGRVTVRDIARELGVSVATISRALSPDKVIADKTRSRVMAKAREMGYAPNLFARGLSSQRSGIAALFASNITNPFYPEVVVKLTRRLQDVGLHTMLFTSVDDAGADAALPLLRQYNPDIVIILAASMTPEALNDCVDGHTPVILFNRYIEGARASAVCCDNYEGGYLVATSLAEAGHERPAFISGLEAASTNIDRRRGFCDGCAAAGMPAPQIISGGDFNYATGYEGMKSLASGNDRPDAVFCANDIVAIGAMDAARRDLGLSIPRDLSVVGFDDIEMASWPSHELTTVRQPMNAMIECVIAEMNRLNDKGDTASRDQFLPGRLMVRKSARLVAPDKRADT